MERDVPATVTALMFYYLSGQPSYIGEIDYVGIDNNEAFFVNDNCLPPSLLASKQRTEVVGGDIFIGLTTGKQEGLMIKGVLRSGPVTLAKIGGFPAEANRLSMGIVSAEVLPFEPAEATLSNARVRFHQPIKNFLYAWSQKGLEHHMVINHSVGFNELSILCEILEIKPEIISK